MDTNLPLNECYVMTSSLIINRLHMFLHGIALLALVNYRITTLYLTFKANGILSSSNISHVLIFFSELILAMLWLLSQAFRWRPVKRSVYPERLPKDDDKLPGIDVFICTADPDKEPSIGVMNTVISTMALDYPADKLNVYLSDDGGSPLTLFAMKEGWKFACFWVPFCRKYRVKIRCPEAYFGGDDEHNTGGFDQSELILDKEKLKKLYEEFKDRVLRFKENQGANTTKDHAPIIEVIRDASFDVEREMPLLVYVSREKRPSQHHHFKAGALNVLIRVSGILSNSPYILILDCDMYCSDPSSARQAMCFHLDKKISARLAFVQFPQKFHNVSENDIYDGELRSYFMLWKGFDGANGPVISGTNFYIRRNALYGVPNLREDVDVPLLQKLFGDSNEFITSTYQSNKPINQELISSVQLDETKHVASSAYEKDNQWGEEVGFRYESVAEDHFTGYMLSCNSWMSVYIDPSRPAFLGSTTTNLSDLLVQNTRWIVGLGQIVFSKYTPLLYGPPRMSILQCMCYAELQYRYFYFFPMWCLAILPQLCLVRGVPLYPAASSSVAQLFGFLFLSSSCKYLQEVLFSGYSIRTWLYDYRIWMIKSVTCFFYGTLFAFLAKTGTREASFLPTNKVVDVGQTKRYQAGIFDFVASNMFIVPICTLVILNAGALILGGIRTLSEESYDEMFIQLFIMVFILVVQYPVIEGMIFRKDTGRVALFATTISALLAMVALVIGYATFV